LSIGISEVKRDRAARLFEIVVSDVKRGRAVRLFETMTSEVKTATENHESEETEL